MKKLSDEAKFIKSRREELGISQEELARLVGKRTKQYVSYVENGVNGIPIWMIRSFAKALRVDVKRLVYLRLRAYEDEVMGVVFGGSKRK